MIGDASHDEEQVGQAIEIHDQDRLYASGSSATTRRSARRQTVRAKCSSDAGRRAAGKDEPS